MPDHPEALRQALEALEAVQDTLLADGYPAGFPTLVEAAEAIAAINRTLAEKPADTPATLSREQAIEFARKCLRTYADYYVSHAAALADAEWEPRDWVIDAIQAAYAQGIAANSLDARGEPQRITARPLVWDQDSSALWTDQHHGFSIMEEPGDELPFCAAWGEGDAEQFSSLEQAKAWCQEQIDGWVERHVVVAGARPVEGTCAECGKVSTPDSMWALYCLGCIETTIGPALASLPRPLVPLTEKQIDAGLKNSLFNWRGEHEAFSSGVRYAERHHGIGGTQGSKT